MKMTYDHGLKRLITLSEPDQLFVQLFDVQNS